MGFSLSGFSDVHPSKSQKRQAGSLSYSGVEILRIRLCSSCATIAEAEEKYWRFTALSPFRGRLSSLCSFEILEHAQGKLIPAARCAAFPHFHSDGYYYGLYTSYKTGYSSPSQ